MLLCTTLKTTIMKSSVAIFLMIASNFVFMFFCVDYHLVRSFLAEYIYEVCFETDFCFDDLSSGLTASLIAKILIVVIYSRILLRMSQATRAL